MKKINCKDFEARLDEFVSGTLPDFERGNTQRHLRSCRECSDLERASRAIVDAARAETLELPGDAYFHDLRWRVEEELAREGTWDAWRRKLRQNRKPLISMAQAAALMIALLSTAIWASTSFAMNMKSSKSSQETTNSATVVTLRDQSVTIQKLAMRKNYVTVIYRLMDEGNESSTRTWGWI